MGPPEDDHSEFEPVFNSLPSQNGFEAENNITPVNNADSSKHLSISVNTAKRKRSSSSRHSSLNVQPIGPVFKRSTSVTIPKSCFEEKNSDHSDSYSKSCPNKSMDFGYGSINDTNSDVMGETTTDPQQANGDADGVSEVSESEKSTEKLYFGYTKRQFKVFISLVLLSLNDIMGYSAIAPFFPVVAANKGLSATQVGIIFSAYSMFGIFASLVIGIVLVRVGAKFCVITGMFWNAGALFCFGFLDQCDYTWFFVLSIASRCLMGFGSNTAFTAMFAIVFQEFNERAITVLSLSEALVGVGGMIGPLIGGALYEAGGYITPFMVLASVQLILMVMCWAMLPYVPVEDNMASTWPGRLLAHPSALISFAAIIVVFSANGFLTASMSEFLQTEFHFDAINVGTVFLVSSIFYAGLSPLWGYVADRWRNSYLMEIGFLGISVGMTVLGPITLLKHAFGWMHQKIWLVYVAAIINGSFFGAALMPTFNEMLLGANELNLQETVLAQYGLVSGLWNMGFSIGDIVGPTLGGVLVQKLAFADASGIFAATCVVLLLLKLFQRYMRYKFHKVAPDNLLPVETDERRPLLDDQETA